ncbi:SDR family oxidoreductase [Mesoterricola sediminis]|uniref:NAD(P)-dependent oxidoreductase n=1 Tax=Mesoterricola sediminis TaxID=2927980 RepID=A0AA48KCX9_9BACT|nr:SDR family oxidoreductase [Mesoterricola sediminis]BDU76505.1 NAD(P)-dependent oxidoreductase [Mesoterricola sediminis]
MSPQTLLVTGASGQLGRLVLEALLERHPAERLVAAVRHPAAVADLAARGVQVREADYTRPETLRSAFQGVDRLLLISSNAIGQRTAQHRAVVEAARAAGVGLLAYTSVLRADTSPLGLAREHVETEALVRASGLPWVFLRNGWYTENHTASLPAILAHGAVLGAAGEGRFATAARADYAAAAAQVLLADHPEGQTLELAGDTAYTLADLAGEIARQTGKPIVYRDLPQAEFAGALTAAGLPGAFADLLADSDAGAKQGGLDDAGGQLSRLIGRPTTPLAETVRRALA